MLVELEDAALLSLGTVLEELGVVVALLPAWLLELFMSLGVVLLGVVLVAGVVDVAPGAVAAFWSVVVDGAAVGFAWLDV